MVIPAVLGSKGKHKVILTTRLRIYDLPRMTTRGTCNLMRDIYILSLRRFLIPPNMMFIITGMQLTVIRFLKFTEAKQQYKKTPIKRNSRFIRFRPLP